ncbi:MAG: 2,3-bisphosphoglycerate-dependent phosphoglycerate mutase [Cytophagales bacterium]|nr:2,3-bisphosphoglycerate-dependent phosphoglycerate mutase [Armatimonadota bacterium]
MGRLLLVRHTESVWNSLNVFTGWVDVSLSERGKGHAFEVGQSLKGKMQIDKAYTSGLIRAHQTLDQILAGADLKNLPVVQDWHLNERFYGNWQGKNKAQTAEKYGEEAVHAVRRGYAARPPGGESLQDTTERVLAYFEETIEPELVQGMTLLIAAHGNSLRALVKKLDNLSDEVVPGVEIANGELIIYRRGPDGSYVREPLALNH